MRKRLLASVALTAFLISPAIFASTRDELAQTQQDLEKSKKHQAELAEQNQALEAELAALQKKLVRCATDIQANEAALSASLDRLRVLEAQMKTKSDALAEHQKNLASLLQAAIRLSQAPPEAMVMMPGDTEQTMKAGRASRMAADSIKQEMDSIRVQLDELKHLDEHISKRRDDIARRGDALDKQRVTLTSKLSERKLLQEKLGKEVQAEAERVEQLAKKSQNLQSLMSSLLEGHKRRTAQETPEEAARRGKLRSFADAKGHIHMPLSGKVVESFGNDNAQTAKGIVIQAHAGAEVVAPYDGEVVFTGPFLGYGKIVIIRHSDEFHTLLAGLAKIDARPGEFLLEGEPIGAMGSTDSDSRLYVELRKNNQPVNPEPWISGLHR